VKRVPDDDLITYCGLYCGLCAERCTVPLRARELMDLVRDEGYDQFYEFVPGINDHYPSFIKVLEEFSALDCRCRNRKGGPPSCAIYACAAKKGAFVCMDCEDFPCDKWNAISRIHPLLKNDADRYREVGKERWLEEQRVRAEKGFCYGMIKQIPAQCRTEGKRVDTQP
jgi:hypothetical protein